MDEESSRLVVRPCRAPDVAALEEQFPTGPSRFHEQRFRRQEEGGSTLLIAVLGGVPVGSGEVMWPGPKEPDVRRRFPGCPEINGLNVAADRRSQGIGTAVIRGAERLAATRGHERIGLGVDDGNGRAAALYLRLGYAETGCRYLDRYQYVDAGGRRHDVADPCRFLVKELTPLRPMADAEISAGLAPLRPLGYRKVPVEGKWQPEPYATIEAETRTLAVLCVDPGVARLTVDRHSGEVWLAPEDGPLDLVNSSLERLVRCSQAVRKAARATGRLEDDDEALEALAARTLADVRQIDPAAVRHENQLWSAVIEELGYGM